MVLGNDACSPANVARAAASSGASVRARSWSPAKASSHGLFLLTPKATSSAFFDRAPADRRYLCEDKPVKTLSAEGSGPEVLVKVGAPAAERGRTTPSVSTAM